VRISAVVREAGTLTLTAVSSAQPGDVQSANDTAGVTTLVRPAAPVAVPAQVVSLRASATRVTRSKATAMVSVRISTGGAVRLEARLTPLRSTRPITLLAGTSLAGSHLTKPRLTATATVPRAASYLFKARVAAGMLTRGRTYLVRLTAVAADGRRRTLTIRLKA